MHSEIDPAHSARAPDAGDAVVAGAVLVGAGAVAVGVGETGVCVAVGAAGVVVGGCGVWVAVSANAVVAAGVGVAAGAVGPQPAVKIVRSRTSASILVRVDMISST